MKHINKLFALALISLITLTSCLDTDGFPDNDPVPFEEQLAIDVDIIETYLDENEIIATKDDSGIYFVIESEGFGAAPTLADEVKVDYHGRLLTNQVFDSSNDSETKPVFALNRLIQAWQIMLPQIKEGGSITIYAPSVYCYGSQSSGSIPPSSSLIFEIDLLEVIPE